MQPPGPPVAHTGLPISRAHASAALSAKPLGSLGICQPQADEQGPTAKGPGSQALFCGRRSVGSWAVAPCQVGREEAGDPGVPRPCPPAAQRQGAWGQLTVSYTQHPTWPDQAGSVQCQLRAGGSERGGQALMMSCRPLEPGETEPTPQPRMMAQFQVDSGLPESIQVWAWTGGHGRG